MTLAVKLTDIRKTYGGVKALNGASLELKPGEVHAVLGENGAGKSTLMNVLGGATTPDSGTINVGADIVTFRNPRDAQASAISVIHQETALAGDLTVAENVFLSEIPGVINWRAMNKKAKSLIDQLGFAIEPNSLVRDLSVAHQQVVEIAKALSHESKVVVFDEPTAVLSVQDAERLMTVIRQLRDDGVGIIYISHRLDEVFKIADRVTVLKDGATVKTIEAANTNISEVIEMMVGRQLSTLFGDDVERSIGEIALEVGGIPTAHDADFAEFVVRNGEIVGIGGLVGAGRTDLVRQIFGADKSGQLNIKINGKPVKIASPRQGVANGIALVPENRKEQGVVLSNPIKWNVTMSKMSSVVNRLGFIRRRHENVVVNEIGEALKLKSNSIDEPVSTLSGGNQQKVVLAKWLHAGGEVLMFDEPTRGVDVGAKTEIYTLIKKLAAQGKAVLVISSEHLELFGLCDRVIVMGNGRITGALEPDQFSETNLLKLAMT